MIVSMLCLAVPAAAQSAAPPHAWLFGAWTGGLFPPPVTLNAQECLGQPTVIFTRDSVLRESVTSPAYVQRLIETVRATKTGAAFRFIASAQTPAANTGMFNLTPDQASEPGFGCADPNTLDVHRHGNNQITFANCPAFPYPLIRCPSH